MRRRVSFPQGPRFSALTSLDASVGDGLGWAFGALGLQDRAQHIASLYIDDLADAIRDGIDPRFELSRYAEKLAASAPSFDPILASLDAEPTLVDRYLDGVALDLMEKHKPDVIGITMPFPGNVYGAFRIARMIKLESKHVKIVMGGGYVNTELRELSDPRVFDFVDYITLDDGERPLLCLLEQLAGKSEKKGLLRTLLREEGQVVFKNNPTLHDIPFKDAGTPTYDGLPLDQYLSLCELAQSHAPSMVRRALEQANSRSRLLLEKMQLLRHLPRLHRALRRPNRGSNRGSY